jgi:hypothetical protein
MGESERKKWSHKITGNGSSSQGREGQNMANDPKSAVDLGWE